MKVALRAAAITAYGAYWGLWLFGYLDINRGDVSRVLFGALVIGAPCFLAGAAIGRWWAPAIGLVFVGFIPLADHCVSGREASDAFFTYCAGFAASDLPIVLAVTTPCILAGVAAVKLLARYVPRPTPAA
jgi:hypothetical protein